jgi:hypothetical protein
MNVTELISKKLHAYVTTFRKEILYRMLLVTDKQIIH